MQSRPYKVALVYPPLCERFSYYRFGPRIAILGLGYLQAFLNDNDIAADQIDLDNLLHRKTDVWRMFDEYGPLTDDSVIERYLEGAKCAIDYDIVFRFLMDAVEWKEFDMLGFSYEIAFLRDAYTPAFFRFLREVTRQYHIPVVMGGVGVASMDIVKLSKRFDFIKYVVFGRSDSIILDSFLKIIQYEKGAEVDVADILNICYKNQKGKVRASFAKEIPSPKVEKQYILKPHFDLRNNSGFKTTYSDFCQIDSGLPEGYFGEDVGVSIIPYRFTVNCINKCAFCLCSAEGNRFAFKDAREVVDDLERLTQENDSNSFMFLNAMINFSKKYLDQVLDEMQRRNLEIRFTDSAEFYGMDDEMLQIIKEMGAIALWFGLECPSNRLLEFIHKRCTVEQAEYALACSNKLGIWNGVNLINGLPQERDEDIEMTIQFVKKNIDIVDMWQVTPFYLVKSRFLEHPECYGIKVRDLEVVEDKGEGNLVMASFDEIGGLTWEDKKKKTAESFKRVVETIDVQAVVPNLSNMGLLFFLYRTFSYDKGKVKQWLATNYSGYAPKIRALG